MSAPRKPESKLPGLRMARRIVAEAARRSIAENPGGWPFHDVAIRDALNAAIRREEAKEKKR